MATLTSTGAVNLTSSTNWSPAQVPVAGDDLVIGADTLTLDADLVLGSITTTSGSSRITISGNRTITATTWDLSGDGLFNAIASQVVNLFGKFTINNTSSTSLGFLFQSISNSTLKLSTIGENPSSVLFEPKTASAGLRLFNGDVAITNLTTIGRINFTNTAASILFNGVTDIFSSWTHNSVGENYVYGSFVCQRFNGSVSLLLNISGNFHYQNPDTPSNTFAHWQVTGSNNSIFTGNHSIDLLPSQAAIGMLNLLAAFTGSVTIVGKWTSTFNFNAINVNAGSLLYRNQSITISATEQTVVNAAAPALINLEGLQALVSGSLLFTLASTTSVIVNSGTLLSCTSEGLAMAGIVQATLRGKIVKLPNVVPTLPATQDVSVGTTYGYSGSEIIGTGLIIDPAIISSAVLAAQLATLQKNTTYVVERTLEDTKALTFGWHSAVETVQGQVSLDNGAYVPVTGAIAFLRSESGKHYYTLAYNAADRPTVEGTARYRFYSDTDSMYANLRVLKASPRVVDVQAGLALEATSQSVLSGVTALHSNDRSEFF